MNSRLLIAFLALTNLTGCIIVGSGGGSPPPPPPKPGDVTFTWSFAGATCNEVPQVSKVAIDIPGEQLQNDGVYPCLANDYPGIVLHDFRAGTYTFTIEALGYSNESLFTGSGSFTVNGDVRVTIDLTPVGGANSYAYITWQFPANGASSHPTCEQAGVSLVDVSIDGTSIGEFACSSGFTQPGVQTPFLNAGSHSIYIVAMTSNRYPMYEYSGTLQTFTGGPVAADYALNWAVGGAALKWQLTNGSVGQTCAQAGIQTMSINFQDEQGYMVYGTSGDIQACDAAPITYDFLQPGTYRVFIQGTGPGGTYSSNYQSPPTITVTAGQFVPREQALNVTLYKL